MRVASRIKSNRLTELAEHCENVECKVSELQQHMNTHCKQHKQHKEADHFARRVVRLDPHALHQAIEDEQNKLSEAKVALRQLGNQNKSRTLKFKVLTKLAEELKQDLTLDFSQI